jgi:hypothetical protein
VNIEPLRIASFGSAVPPVGATNLRTQEHLTQGEIEELIEAMKLQSVRSSGHHGDPAPCARSWTFSSTFYPGRYDRTKFFLGPRGRSARTRMPCPAHQVVLRHVLVEQSETASTVASGFFDLTADLRRRFSLPCHLDRCQSPSRMTGNALVACGADERKILVRVARCARQAGDSDASFPAGGRGPMNVLVITLGRMVA